MVMHVIMTNLCACCMVWGTDHHFEGHFLPRNEGKGQIHMRVGQDLHTKF